MAERIVIGPQPGPQTTFLTTPADIAIYGGAAGGGKSFALLLDPLRHIKTPGFGAVIFRRNTVQVTNEGALWDESTKLYPYAGGVPKEHQLYWSFPYPAGVAADGTPYLAGKTAVSFAHLEHDKTVNEYQGSQIPMMGFDELTHFTAKQFWYMVSRNRSTCGVRPYIRATCNPDADSWVAELIAWWIDQETGYPIPERAGVLRWFIRVGDEIIWADSPEELAHHVDNEGQPIPAKSLTFIPAKLSDNKAMNEKDPYYRANLMALPLVEREQLLNGNWKIRPAAGLLFQRTWCKVVTAAPKDIDVCRGWDLAGTPKTSNNDPDWTCGTLIGRSRSTGRFIVLDHVRFRDTPSKVKEGIANTASQDTAVYGPAAEIDLPQDTGSSGKSWAQELILSLASYIVTASPESGDKAVRFGPFSSQAEAGNVDVLAGPWNKVWFEQLEAFPTAKHDDDADSTSRAMNHFVKPMKGAAMYELARREAMAVQKAQQAPADEPEPYYAPGSVEWQQQQAKKRA